MRTSQLGRLSLLTALAVAENRWSRRWWCWRATARLGTTADALRTPGCASRHGHFLVRLPQRWCKIGLAAEAGTVLVVRGHVCWQYLQGVLTRQPGVFGEYTSPMPPTPASARSWNQQKNSPLLNGMMISPVVYPVGASDLVRRIRMSVGPPPWRAAWEAQFDIGRFRNPEPINRSCGQIADRYRDRKGVFRWVASASMKRASTFPSSTRLQRNSV